MANKKVIVTGVTGQCGSYMVEYLLEKTDYDIFGLIRRSSNPNLNNLAGVINNPRFKLITGDLSDSQSIDSLVKTVLPDYFINLAAQSYVGISWDIPEHTFDIDAVGVIRCLEAIRKHAPLCRFYNAGSSEEFGDVQYTPQNEKHPLRARSPYGAAKIASRQITKVYRESYNLYAIQGILFNHESERRGPEFVTRKISMGVARIKRALEKGQKFEPIVLGHLESKRDWSHARDFVDGIWKMLNQQKPFYIGHSLEDGLRCNEIWKNWQPKEYVLSSGETHTIREFIEKSFKAAKIEVFNSNPEELPPTYHNNAEQINYILNDGTPVISVSREHYRPSDVDVLLGDSSLARKELNWCPEIGFDKLVELMVLNDIRLLS